MESLVIETTCVCGRTALIYKKHVKTQFKGKWIVVENTPLFECDQGHVNFPRRTRMGIKNLLMKAYETSVERIDFQS